MVFFTFHCQGQPPHTHFLASEELDGGRVCPTPLLREGQRALALSNFSVFTDTMLGSLPCLGEESVWRAALGRGSRPGCYIDRVQASQAPAHQEAAMSALQPERARCPCEPCT